METIVYRKILSLISDIDSKLLIYKIIGFPDNDPDSIKNIISEKITDLMNTSLDLENELDSYFIEKGDVVITRYLKTLGTKTLDSISTLLNEYMPPEFVAQYFGVKINANNVEYIDRLFILKSGEFYLNTKRRSNDQILSKEDIVAYYIGILFQIYYDLKKAKPKELETAIEIESGNVKDEIIFNLSSYNEKLLFIKHCGMFDALKEKHKKNNGEPHLAKIASVIAYITQLKSIRTIESKLGFLETPEKKGTNNPYTAISVPNVIKALDDAGITDQWLLDFSKQYYNESKD